MRFEAVASEGVALADPREAASQLAEAEMTLFLLT